ncbi:MAG: amidohydrolase family protein [Candidatus Methanoplasma sp.]|jgi:cytosine/adenosine deaminase-related metal-dependent hydrolase|nr:amidohydrolase family protein [Candidatus Methanoplasma sp.]
MIYLSGSILTKDGFIEGYAALDDDIIAEISEGRPPERPFAEGAVVPPLVNAHTHCADHGLGIPPGLSIGDAVAPPDGLKHTYLRTVSDDILKENIRSYSDISRNNGIGRFIDFREGGVKGCSLLRSASLDAVILGRPVSKEYDSNEIADILGIADGIGLPSISDMDPKYIEKVADQTRSSGKIFAIHASERIREDIDAILSLDPAFIVHMLEATDGDISKCAETEVPIVVCPTSNGYFGKIPPIKRMMDCGADVAIGTDNAMFCAPDLRSEASLFKKILVSQGGDPEDVWKPFLRTGRNLLYSQREMYLNAGDPADVTVLPYRDVLTADSVLDSRERVTALGKRGDR